jgi:hypothetical protein
VLLSAKSDNTQMLNAFIISTDVGIMIAVKSFWRSGSVSNDCFEIEFGDSSQFPD